MIIFDLDGTLVEFPHEHLFSTALQVLEAISHPPVARGVLEECFADFDFYRFVDAPLRSRFTQELNFIFNSKPFPRAVPFTETERSLSALKEAGYTLALATARAAQPQALEETLAHTGLLGFFSCVAARSDHAADWSDKTEQLQRICRSLGFHPRQGIMVGDIPSDISNARQIGIGLTAALTSGGTRREVLLRSQPDLLFERIEELARHLLDF